MLVSRLIPLVAMGAVAAHSGGAIKDRLASATGVADKVVTKQRCVAILEAATLATSAEEDFSLEAKGGFRAWVKRAVRIKGGGDPSVDLWGTALKGEMNGRTMTVTSAGPDKKFGTKDDIKVTQDIFNY